MILDFSFNQTRAAFYNLKTERRNSWSDFGFWLWSKKILFIPCLELEDWKEKFLELYDFGFWYKSNKICVLEFEGWNYRKYKSISS